jgi:GNAT superfamily N-acetyltransferase
VTVSVRRYEAGDEAGLSALYERTRNPYRAEDMAAVEAMHLRARRAKADTDRWVPLPSDERHVHEREFAAFWVAQAPGGEVVGTLGLRFVGDASSVGVDTAENSGLPFGTGRLAELRRLRVDPDWRRLGVASRLTQEALRWARAHGLEGAVLNTTAAQAPALALYRKLGFQEAGRSYVGEFELVWLIAGTTGAAASTDSSTMNTGAPPM